MPPYSIFMMIFSVAIILYAAILGFTKDPKMLPYNVQASVKGKSKKYISRLAVCTAVTALAPAAAAVVGIWSPFGMLITLIVGLVVCLWLSTRIIRNVD